MIASLSTPVLLDYLKKCRWFAGKARQVESCMVKHEIPVGDAWIWILEVAYEEGDKETYQLPVALVEKLPDNPAEQTLITETEKGLLVDAIYTDSFRNVLYSRVFHGDKDEALTFTTGKGLQIQDVPEHISSRVLAVDSSNSALVFGEKYFFKLYRKLFRETNPEVEMVQFITENSDFTQIPPFCGSMTWRRAGATDITLGMMQGKVEARMDNWSLTGDYLNEFLYAVPNAVFTIQENVFEQVALLGKRTAEMHAALYNPQAEVNFSPEPFTEGYRRFLQQRLSHLLNSRYTLLIDKYLSLDEPTKRLAWKFMEAKELIDEFSEDLLKQPLDSLRIRIHGDYHLGQVLSADHDFILIDFEGEPEASIQDRKIKHSPLKDVAGMIRSYHYAVSSKVFTSDETRHISPEKLLVVTDRWYRLMKETYLDAYMEALGWPHPLFKDQNEINSLLLYYLLEKAVYELGYELSYRPDWVKIPLKGIADVIREIEKMHG
ncbi:putative maltokinase [Arundinibacter roseus]|uniref:Maltokinase n=1 Tax=Arundinibacter roseus TaxID=2070510 RepID=A0A4R4KFG7_9BACT|nr:putative maltokinase [Arundinibacter roseus]TDB65279.1 trehalose synthase [Arundinibacter roseus]